MSIGVLYLTLTLQASGLSCHSNPDCFNYQNDDFCDEICNTLICNFDSAVDFSTGASYDKFKLSDCFIDCLETEACDKDKLSNQICDEECNTQICGFDLGYCGYCSSGCETYTGLKSMLGDGHCDSACNVEACFNDWGDCIDHIESIGDCTQKLLGNKQCDAACNSSQFNFDNYYCVRPTQPCSTGCTYQLLHNNLCDAACNSKDCLFDYNDCVMSRQIESSECTYALLTNNVRDEECYTDHYLADNFIVRIT